jgi:hypothetical protein
MSRRVDRYGPIGEIPDAGVAAIPPSELSRRSSARLVLALVLASAISIANEASPASASAPARHSGSVAEKKKPKKKKPVSLAKAAAWVAVGTQLGLNADQPAPEQFTDPAAPRVQQIAALITGLGFKGVAVQTFSRTQPDPSDPTLPIGNYIVKVVVFRSTDDARKFSAADAKEVTDKGSLKQVATYAHGVVLDDAQGHINVMFPIRNVAVDLRSGIAEQAPGDGVKDIKEVAAAVVANSKSS